VPAEQLLSGQGWDGRPRQVTDEPGPLAVFANFLLLAQGQETSLGFHYRLPNDLALSAGGQWTYALVVQKQAGTIADLVTVVVTLPAGSTLLAASPAPTSTSGRDIIFEGRLLTDLQVELRYR
jgi:hypothetical protein